MGVEDLGFRSHLSHQTLTDHWKPCAEGANVTEVRSGTTTPRKQTVDPQASLWCDHHIPPTLQVLQLSPDLLYIKQSSLQTASYIQTGRNGVGLGEVVEAVASKRIFTSGETVGRKAEIMILFGAVWYFFISFWKNSRSLTGKRVTKEEWNVWSCRKKVRKQSEETGGDKEIERGWTKQARGVEESFHYND